MPDNNRIYKVAAFLMKAFPKGIQMFDCHGGDPTSEIYDEDDIRILHSAYWEYVEVLGLEKVEYEALKGLLREKGWNYE